MFAARSESGNEKHELLICQQHYPTAAPGLPTPLFARVQPIVPRGLLRLVATEIAMKRFLCFAASCVLSLSACKGKPGADAGQTATSSASTSGSLSEYKGPHGVVRGVVRITGDEPPNLPSASEIPVGKCFKAHERHSKVFRKAADGGVADALVGVTEYKASLPKPTTPVVVGMEDCSLSQRTIALTMGQSIQAKNRGPTAAMPQLVGLPTPAVLVAVPGGEPVTLVPNAPGRFQLVDRSHPFATADVFVVGFPTVTVTDEAGRFEFPVVPAEEVRVSVMLPETGLSAEKRVTVAAGETLDLTFELTFDLAKHNAALELGKAQQAASAAAASATAAPSVAAPVATTPTASTGTR